MTKSNGPRASLRSAGAGSGVSFGPLGGIGGEPAGGGQRVGGHGIAGSDRYTKRAAQFYGVCAPTRSGYHALVQAIPASVR